MNIWFYEGYREIGSKMGKIMLKWEKFVQTVA